MTAANTNRPNDTRDHILKTYAALRLALLLAGLALPVGLIIGSKILQTPIQDSISQYYHADREFAPTEDDRKTLEQGAAAKDRIIKKDGADADKFAKEHPDDPDVKEWTRARAEDKRLYAKPGAGELRDWFVGCLFIVGILLIVYKGFLPDEDRALNLAGFSAMGVAFFHMPWGEPQQKGDNHLSWIDEISQPLFHKLLPWTQHLPSIHYLCALLVFLCLGYICFWCGSATLDLDDTGSGEGKGRPLTPKEKTWLRRAYRLCGVFMASAIVVGPFFTHVPGIGLTSYARVFVMELIGVLGFVLYWGLKSWELHTTGADRPAVRREVKMERSTHLFTGHKLRAGS